jgi:glutamine synthetase
MAWDTGIFQTKIMCRALDIFVVEMIDRLKIMFILQEKIGTSFEIYLFFLPKRQMNRLGSATHVVNSVVTRNLFD